MCEIFPAHQSLVIGIINGMFDASAGTFLFFKFAYDAIGVTLKNLLILYALGSGMIWIKMIWSRSLIKRESCEENLKCLPEETKTDQNQTKMDPNQTKTDPYQTKIDTPLPAWKYACSLKYLIIIIFYTSLQVRVSSFQSWLYPWLKWTFSGQDSAEAEYNVSLLMDVYGYSYFSSIFIAPLPGLFIKWMQRVFKSNQIGEQRAITVLMVLTGPLKTHQVLLKHILCPS